MSISYVRNLLMFSISLLLYQFSPNQYFNHLYFLTLSYITNCTLKPVPFQKLLILKTNVVLYKCEACLSVKTSLCQYDEIYVYRLMSKKWILLLKMFQSWPVKTLSSWNQKVQFLLFIPLVEKNEPWILSQQSLSTFTFMIHFSSYMNIVSSIWIIEF